MNNMDNKFAKERILNAFPALLKQDVEKVIEILPLDEYDVLLSDSTIYNVSHFIHESEQVVKVDNEVLKIPCRLWFNEPNCDREAALTCLQKTILNCIYLRHSNGFIRQRRLEKLVDTTDYFVTPFVFQLLGEYVLEILFVLDRHINEHTLNNYLKFIGENKEYSQKTESRMISYWNAYYRRLKYKKINDYIGKKVIDKLRS
ncbi:hypothetical protein [Hymenobacter guriensis]|uniref:Uncharacterized protein n=1 Tax=Hymenobacter guriensis TaxID=2793065 RepID=A0ABS0KW61_9BACT|nr:hypothetical protein [Hymenobacter guriensis]MBG8552115.1 hypothetical protein [Hymenobacter guriensis]